MRVSNVMMAGLGTLSHGALGVYTRAATRLSAAASQQEAVGRGQNVQCLRACWEERGSHHQQLRWCSRRSSTHTGCETRGQLGAAGRLMKRRHGVSCQGIQRRNTLRQRLQRAQRVAVGCWRQILAAGLHQSRCVSESRRRRLSLQFPRRLLRQARLGGPSVVAVSEAARAAGLRHHSCRRANT